MKTSKYNYYIPYGDKHIFFNGITKRFFLVSESNKDKFIDIIEHPDNNIYQEKYSPFIERMKKEGFIHEDDVEEKTLIKKLFEQQRCPDMYMLMILPTYQCNLRCWYCIQEHQNVNLTGEMVCRIKKHIQKYLLQTGLKKFRLSWFGGEPLLAYDKLTDLTAFAQTFCKKHGIEFFCDITTNSLLLTPERIKHLGEIGVTKYQITIDGCREQHNQVKRTKDNTAFDKTINNIIDIVKNNQKAFCSLRINYSQDTLEPEKIINDINQLIPQEFRHKINVSPCKIWQVDDADIKPSEVKKLHTLARKEHFKTGTPKSCLCYVDFTHFNCIFPNGRVGKCDNDTLENTRGVISEDGDIIWDDRYPFERHQSFSEDCECYTCKHLPFCMGPCPFKRDQMIKKFGKVVCLFTEPEENISKSIISYCENHYDISNQ